MKKRMIVMGIISVLILAAIAEAQVYRKINLGHTSYGMTTDEVRRAIGRPDHINTYAGSGGEMQQWVYYEGPEQSLFLYFRNGIFTSYQEFGKK